MDLMHGWHVTDNSSLNDTPLPACLALDNGGVDVARRSLWKMVRITEKGNPSVQGLVERCHYWLGQGFQVKLLNELNNPHEGFQGGPGAYREIWNAVEAAGVPMEDVYWQSPSPGFPDYLDWLPDRSFKGGVCFNAYGYFHEIRAIIEAVRARLPMASLVLSEFNPAWGREGVNFDQWAAADLPAILDYCSSIEQLEAALYFADNWNGPDMPGRTFNGKGTLVETVMHSWQPKIITKPQPPKEKEMDALTKKFWDKMNQLLPGKCHDYRGKVHHEANGQKYITVDSKAMSFSVIHHSESPRSTTVESIDNYHITNRTNLFPGIGYHGVIRLGEFYLVSSLNCQRAHVKGRNDEALGWCVTGDYTDARPAADDIAVMRAITAALDVTYGREKQNMGHRELLGPGYLCPGNLLAVWKTIRSAPAGTITVTLPIPPFAVADKLVFMVDELARDARDEFNLPAVHDYVVEHLRPATVNLKQRSR